MRRTQKDIYQEIYRGWKKSWQYAMYSYLALPRRSRRLNLKKKKERRGKLIARSRYEGEEKERRREVEVEGAFQSQEHFIRAEWKEEESLRS